MGLSSIVKSIRIEGDYVISSTPAFYTAVQHTIFTITGGPVWIKAVIEYLDTAMTNATTTNLHICGHALDAGPALIGALPAGYVTVSPLYVVPKVAANSRMEIPNPVALGDPNDRGLGIIAGPGGGGLIQVTFATVMDAVDRYSLHVVYQKLSPASLIS